MCLSLRQNWDETCDVSENKNVKTTFEPGTRTSSAAAALSVGGFLKTRNDMQETLDSCSDIV